MATCFPPAFGVPGLFGAPQWWDPTGAERPYSTDLNDPRWNGATRRGFGQGGGVTGVLRGLHFNEADRPVLYLSMQVFNDPSVGDADGIRLGLQTPTPAGAPANLFVIQVEVADAPTPKEAGNTVNNACLRIVGTGAPTAHPNPSWLNRAKAWLRVKGGGGGTPQTFDWAINLRIPTKPAGDGAAAFDDQ